MVNVAGMCEFNYGAMGRVGFFYESMKDQLKWNGLSRKHYIKLISQVGQILSMNDDDYNKEKAKATKMSNSSLVEALISAFGDQG